MKYLLPSVLALSLCAFATADVINVPADFSTIQTAIDAAFDGDEVLVAPGTYEESIDFLGKAITVRSEAGPETTTIRDNSEYKVRFSNFEGTDSILDGFTIRSSVGSTGRGLLLDFSNPTISNCHFIGHSVVGHGAGVYAVGSAATLSFCVFDGNNAGTSPASFGGAIYAEASSVSIASSTFDTNRARLGGAVFSTNFSNTQLASCTFTSNTATSSGGSLYNTNNSGITVHSCHFEMNEASSGAAVYNTSSSPHFESCVFTNNSTTSGSGGAVLSNSGTVTFELCDFFSNQATSSGGAYYGDRGVHTFTSCDFSDNQSGNSGGAVHFIGFSFDELILDSCLFEANNSQRSGGALALQPGSLVAAGCHFQSNTAIEDGAGLFSSSGGDATLSLCTFVANVSDRNGGAVFQSSGTLATTDCVFDANVAVLGSGLFNNNISGASDVTACLFTNNVTGVSGGIYNDSSSPTITGCEFRSNTAASFGGSVFNIDNSDPEIHGCAFEGNTAFAGAGIYSFDTQSVPTVGSSTFCGNDPEDIGGDWMDDGGNQFLPTCGEPPARLYVDAGSDVGDGLTWDSAFRDLQDALALSSASESVEEIWIAEGTYAPSPSGDRNASFELVRGVALLGGFEGTESDASERDPAAHVTVLSGDLLGDDGPGFTNNADNSYHVVTYAGSGTAEADSPVLDGLVITGGNANGSLASSNERGGGLLVLDSAPVLRDCWIVENAAVFTGGGESFRDASPTFLRCRVSGNVAEIGGGLHFVGDVGGPTMHECVVVLNTSERQGGAMALGGPEANNGTFVNCLFAENQSLAAGGGAISNFKSTQLLINCTLVANSTAGDGGGIRSRGDDANIVLDNSILWGNTASTGSAEEQQLSLGTTTAEINFTNLEGWTGDLGGSGNIGDNPLFADPVAGDWRLGGGSPSIDAADNMRVPEETLVDLDGAARFTDDPGSADSGLGDSPLADMGAYEFQGTSCPADLDGSGDVGFTDLLGVLSAWGPCTCDEDIDGDGDVGFTDLLIVLAAWGPC